MLVVRTAEPESRLETTEPAHRVIALLHSSVVLLDAVIKILVGSVLHSTPQYPAYGPRVGILPIGRHLCRFVANHFSRLGEELLGRLHIPVLGEHGINQVAVPINGPL